MALNIELWEDSGVATGTPAAGTTRHEVNNLGFKSAAWDETYPFVDYPVTRPYGGNLYTVSFKKYYYFKIYGTYDYAHKLKVSFTGNPSGAGAGSGIAPKVRVLYKWTNTYETPDNSLLAGSTYDPNTPLKMLPLLSTQGPEYAGSYVDEMTSNTTYYTQYLVTQLLVEPGNWDDYGNLNTMTLRIDFDERKSGLPGYDSELVNWEW